MHPMNGVAGLAEWAGPDLAHNLDFIPEDRLNWKPAPDSKSALECASEAALFMKSMIPVLAGAEWQRPDYSPTSKAEIQELLRTVAKEYADALRALPPERLGEVVSTPFGDTPLGRLAGFPVVDIIHHRGQVCYIQTLLGDKENHFLAG
jgi:DinB superfamily